MSTRIVIVDDDIEDITLLRKAINNSHPAFELSTYDDSEIALEELLWDEAQIPDFVFLDINMPKVTGPECLSALKKDKRYDGVKIVMISTYMPQELSTQLTQQGAYHTIPKPESWVHYKEVVKEFFDKNSN